VPCIMSGKKSKGERRNVAGVEVLPPVPVAEKRWPLLTIRVLALLGLSIGGYLTVLHFQAGTGGVIDSPFCGVGTTLNCNAVLGSPYARLFGWPVALWAAAAYAAVLLVSFLGQTGLLAVLCGWTFAFSVYMAGLSLLVVKSACPLCLTLYAINSGLLISAIILVRASAALTLRQAAYGLVGCAALVTGIGWLQAQAAATVAPATPVATQNQTKVNADFARYYNSRPLVTLDGPERHTKGPAQATLTISEFVDFRCPQCARAGVVLSQLLAQYPDDVRIIFRHYPLDRDCNSDLPRQVHPGACAAALAAECAGEQGKFWEYANLLFTDQKEYTRQDLTTYAGAVSLDMSRFNTCLADGRMQNIISQDVEEAQRINVKATPTLVINGHLIEGLPSPQQLASLLTLEKQQAGQKK
ncbi:MAG: thioredoxin domain-containing protein, partial [Candidatus Binatia bacterium]